MPDLQPAVRTSPAREIGVMALTEFAILGFFALPLALGYPLLIRGMLALLMLGIGVEVIQLTGGKSLTRRILTGIFGASLYYLMLESYIPQQVQVVIAIAMITLLIMNIYVDFGARFQKWLLIYPVVFVPFISFLALSPAHTGTILFTYLVVESFDSFAYLSGKLLGKTRVFPKLSPKKTLEGLLMGAVCAGMIGGLAASHMIALSSTRQMVLIALIIVCTLFGDLCASRIKRCLGVKDYGHILPLQGGVLDIYDSIIFTAPAVFIYLKLIE
jgi:CDP-diglyceride synthetase